LGNEKGPAINWPLPLGFEFELALGLQPIIRPLPREGYEFWVRFVLNQYSDVGAIIN
jgi:hypothetical protein